MKTCRCETCGNIGPLFVSEDAYQDYRAAIDINARTNKPYSHLRKVADETWDTWAERAGV